MTMPRLTPGVLPEGTRRRVPRASQNRKVELWTPDPGGQVFQGVIRVPAHLCGVPEHTNERLKFDAWITANLERWVEWRRRKGWHLASEISVQEPSDPPEGDRERGKQRMDRAREVIGYNGDVGAVDDFDYAAEYKWCVVDARFTRETPIYVGLEDMLELRHLALRYDVDPDRDPLPYNELPEPKDVIEVDGGLDPMQVAEERRKAMGLKREDYLMGPLWEPL